MTNQLTEWQINTAAQNARHQGKEFDLETQPGFEWTDQNRYDFNHGGQTVKLTYDFTSAGWRCDNGIFFHRDITACEMWKTLVKLIDDEIPFDGRPVEPVEGGRESEQYGL